MADVVIFGEIRMRLATPGYLRFDHAPHLEMTFGGGEANVAVSLANYGVSAEFVTRLPKNELAQRAINELRGIGVETGHIARGGDRLGIYFLEAGASQRASKVIYDRAHSAISQIKPGEINWDSIFSGEKKSRWFHWTGITPALSDSAAEAVAEACEAAKKHGVTVSVDLNFRKKLWSKEKAQKVMSELMRHVDVCIANEEDAESVFGIKGAEVTSGKIDHSQYEDVAAKLVSRFGFKKVAITLRESISASQNGWSAMLFENGKSCFSKKYDIMIVDRVGGGDSFAGGLIFSQLRGDEPQKTIDFAVAASCLKHTISGTTIACRSLKLRRSPVATRAVACNADAKSALFCASVFHSRDKRRRSRAQFFPVVVFQHFSVEQTRSGRERDASGVDEIRAALVAKQSLVGE